MPVRSALPVSFEFTTHNPENLIAVENGEDHVVIRAAHNNFPPRRKSFLIRQLAAEGYIPELYEQFSEEAWHPGIIWTVDRTLITIGIGVRRRSNRFMHRLLLASCLLWVFELVVAYFWVR